MFHLIRSGSDYYYYYCYYYWNYSNFVTYIHQCKTVPETIICHLHSPKSRLYVLDTRFLICSYLHWWLLFTYRAINFYTYTEPHWFTHCRMALRTRINSCVKWSINVVHLEFAEKLPYGCRNRRTNYTPQRGITGVLCPDFGAVKYKICNQRARSSATWSIQTRFVKDKRKFRVLDSSV